MERATREAMDPNLRHKPRLLSDEELPSWLLKDEDEVSKLLHNYLVKFELYNTTSRMITRTNLLEQCIIANIEYTQKNYSRGYFVH